MNRIDAIWAKSGPARFWYSKDGETVFVDAELGLRRVLSRDERLDESSDDDGGGDTVDEEEEMPHASGSSTVETTVTFENRTDASVDVFWLDWNGVAKPYGSVAAGQRRIQHTFESHVWCFVRNRTDVFKVFQANRNAALNEMILNCDDSAIVQRRRDCFVDSPDGNWRAVVRDANVFVCRRLATTADEQQVTRDGSLSDGFSIDALFWSPDSTHLVAMRATAAASVRNVHMVDSFPKDQLQPKLKTIVYAKAGDARRIERPVLFRIVPDIEEVPIASSLFDAPWSNSDVRWASDSSRFTFLHNRRGHQILRIVAVDVRSGVARVAVEERSDTFIAYEHKFHCSWLSDNELVWMSERSGFNHLWLMSVDGGARPITQGDWVVQGVDRVDAERRQVWFRAGGVLGAACDPYFTHVCRVDIDGDGAVTVLTADGDGVDGTHSVDWSPDRRFLIDTWSRIDLPPTSVLRRADSGAVVCVLERAESTAPHPLPHVALGRDGRTPIYGAFWLPRNFDPNAHYPVIEQIYAGPQDFFVPKAFAASWGERQRLADLGAIVVQIDGMGTSGRSKAFHDVCFKNLRDAGLPDRIAWIRDLAARRLPCIDQSRVGIFGGSAGGQSAMAALLWHGDFYKVAVADCGCHDNRMDKQWWNEQWFGWPLDDDAMRASSNVVNAHRLRDDARLLLMVGELDDNVDPASTMQVVGALQAANKHNFELVVLVGVGHGAAETNYGSERRANFFKQHLQLN